MLFRSAHDSDLDAIHHLAKASDIGLTTLPNDKKTLKKRLLLAINSFTKELNEPKSEYYLFVLENTQNKEILGVSGIEAQTGYETPFYSYKISKRTQFCRSLDIRSNHNILHLVNDNQGRSELCTLFLAPEHRKKNLSLLLSRGRFLFMAQHSKRFASLVIADIRGVSNKNGISPFWEQIGSHFFHMSYAEADRITLETDKQFITDLMPRHPIYIKLLSNEAQSIIGQPHPSAQKAMNILLHEGFCYNNYIDIFDAGPTLEAPLLKIKTIESSILVTIKNLSDEISSADYLLANTELDFRATIDSILINIENKTCIISKKTAKLLHVGCGDTIRIVPVEINKGILDASITSNI